VAEAGTDRVPGKADEAAVAVAGTGRVPGKADAVAVAVAGTGRVRVPGLQVPGRVQVLQGQGRVRDHAPGRRAAPGLVLWGIPTKESGGSRLKTESRFGANARLRSCPFPAFSIWRPRFFAKVGFAARKAWLSDQRTLCARGASPPSTVISAFVVPPLPLGICRLLQDMRPWVFRCRGDRRRGSPGGRALRPGRLRVPLHENPVTSVPASEGTKSALAEQEGPARRGVGVARIARTTEHK